MVGEKTARLAGDNEDAGLRLESWYLWRLYYGWTVDAGACDWYRHRHTGTVTGTGTGGAVVPATVPV